MLPDTVEHTMKLSVIALDYDGTLTLDDRLDTGAANVGGNP